MRKAPKELTCIACKEEKPLIEFPIVKGGYYQRGTHCKRCSKLTNKRFNFSCGSNRA